MAESKVIVAFKKVELNDFDYGAVVAYDTNELNLDGVHSNGAEIKPIHADLREIARIRAFHFDRQRRLQSCLAHCQSKLKTKLARNGGRERRRVDAILHRVAWNQVNYAKTNNAKIILEDLKGIRRSINKRMVISNPHNGKLQSASVHSKLLKRRLNNWPFRRLHTFIEYKAMWESVPLNYVPAKNTSRTCPRCGCLQAGRNGERGPKIRQVFQCPRRGWTCNRHLNAALNLLKTQDEGRWFSPDRLLNEVMTTLSEPTRTKLSRSLTEPKLKYWSGSDLRQTDTEVTTLTGGS